jgi:YVTN family beta-propeller protein
MKTVRRNIAFAMSTIAVAVFATVSFFAGPAAFAASSIGAPASLITGNGPTGMVYSTDGSRLYTADMYAGSVTVINPVTKTFVASIATGTGSPAAITVSPDGSQIFVASWSDNKVAVISTANNNVVATLSNLSSAMDVEVSPDSRTLYVVEYGSNTVAVFDLTSATPTLRTRISVGSQPASIAVNPLGDTAFVTNNGSATVSVINTASNTVTGTLTTKSSPWGIAVSPDGAQVAVSHESGNGIRLFANSGNTSVDLPLAVRSFSLTFSPSSSHLYATEFDAGTVDDFDLSNGNLMTVLAPSGASGLRDIAASPDGCSLAAADQNSGKAFFFDVLPCLPNTASHSGGSQGSSGGSGSASSGSPASSANALSNTGNDGVATFAWTAGAVLALLAGASILILRRRA